MLKVFCFKMIDIIDPVKIHYLLLILLSIVSVFALVGNFLVVLILSRPEFIKVSMFRYLIAATIFDTITALISWPSVFPEPFQITANSLSCKLYIYIGYFIAQMSPWIIALSSVDRYLSIKYPKRLSFRNKFIFQILAIAIIFILILIINVPFYVLNNVVLNETGCTLTTTNAKLYLDIFDTLITTVIPTFIMIFSTILTGYLIINQKAKVKISAINLEKEMQLLKVLLAMDLLFLICNLPVYLVLVVNDVLGMETMSSYYYYCFLYVLLNVFYSCDFFVYFAFNKLFRRHFMSMIRCNCKIII